MNVEVPLVEWKEGSLSWFGVLEFRNQELVLKFFLYFLLLWNLWIFAYIYHESYMFFFGVNRFRERTKDTWLIPAVYSSGIIARGDGFYPYLLFQTVTFKQSNL
jgi:hypothetical protein